LDEPAIRSLVDAAHKGDEEAFGALFGRFEPDVARLCGRLLQSADEARDAAHETFLRARQGFEQYDPQRPFRPWLLAIASHHALDRLRRRQTERDLFQPHADDDTQGTDPAPSPLQGELDAELRRRVLRAIDTLPDRYRAPLLLRYYSELDYEAIAELLDVSRGQVGSLLYRARVLLRTQLAEPTA
jgi:RNA polymerase sigma-70 factor (ECF subfamily)